MAVEKNVIPHTSGAIPPPRVKERSEAAQRTPRFRLGRGHRNPLFPLAWMVLGTGCDGCRSTPSVHPLAAMPKEMPVVLEIREAELFEKARIKLPQLFGALLTQTQISNIQEELELSLGFDPTTSAGLAKAGILGKSPIAVGIDQTGFLLIVGSQDQKRLQEAVGTLSLHSGLGKPFLTKPLGNTPVHIFGDDAIHLAFREKLALISAGKNPSARLQKALELTPNLSLLHALKQIDPSTARRSDYSIRLTSLSPGTVVQDLLRLHQRSLPQSFTEAFTGFGCTFDAQKHTFTARGRLSLTPQVVQTLKNPQIPKPPKEPVPTQDQKRWFAEVKAHFNLKGFLAWLAPTKSRARQWLNQAGTDWENAVQGPLEARIGLLSLQGMSLRQLLRNPFSRLWAAAIISTRNPSPLLQAIDRTLEALEKYGFPVQHHRKSAPADVETTGHTLYSNVKKHTLSLFYPKPQQPSASGITVWNGQPKNGITVQLQFQALSQAMETFDEDQLPILFRAMAAKLVQTVSMLDHAKLSAELEPHGWTFVGKLHFKPESEKPL